MATGGHDVRGILPFIFPTLAEPGEYSKPSSHYWVAVDNTSSSVIGTISIISDAVTTNRAELNAFYVQSGYQRCGVGAQLMTEALGFCRTSGIKTVELTSNKGFYDPAIRYYERLGFTRVREYEPERAPGIVLVDMVLELTA